MHNHTYHNTDSILTTLLIFGIGLLLAIIIPSALIWGENIPTTSYVFTRNASLIGITFTLIFVSLHQLSRYPGSQGTAYTIPTVTFWYAALFAYLIISRTYYSIYFITYSFIFTIIYCFCCYFLGARIKKTIIAYPDYGETVSLKEIPGVRWVEFKRPRLPNIRIDGIAADLNTKAPIEWQHFYATCALSRIPVFNHKQLRESLTGRVKIEHLYENQLGAVMPSVPYQISKRLIDTAMVLASFPIVLPLMLITAIVIKLESPGPIMFIQKRVGQGNKVFKIYKFRSMCQDSEKSGAQFATSNDFRVTRVGKFIRKTRIDELPQFFNVLKGDMSLIGPRPEQKVFVDQFTQEIPFYAYRHMVKPGISGWAQVMHGYAADADETQVKIEHDFYYIKYFSLWLDILIVFKTIKTMLSGFGAR